MASPDALIDEETLEPFLVLVLLCGVALLFSVPWAQRVKEFSLFSFLSRLPIYFSAHAFLMGVLGLNLGATSAARGEPRPAAALLLVKRVLLGQFLTLPYLLFARSLYPGKEAALLLILVYTTAFSLACALGGRLLEGPTRVSSSRAFPLKYLAFLLYCLVPLPALLALSPLGLPAVLLGTHAKEGVLLSFAVPTAAAALFFLLLRRKRGGESSA